MLLRGPKYAYVNIYLPYTVTNEYYVISRQIISAMIC